MKAYRWLAASVLASALIVGSVLPGRAVDVPLPPVRKVATPAAHPRKKAPKPPVIQVASNNPVPVLIAPVVIWPRSLPFPLVLGVGF